MARKEQLYALMHQTGCTQQELVCMALDWLLARPMPMVGFAVDGESFEVYRTTQQAEAMRELTHILASHRRAMNTLVSEQRALVRQLRATVDTTHVARQTGQPREG